MLWWQRYGVTTLPVREISAYCGCALCTGPYSRESGGQGLTYSGTVPVEGRTAACGRSWLGLWVEIPKVVRRRADLPSRLLCEDVGGAIEDGDVDIYLDSHEKARQMGRVRL